MVLIALPILKLCLLGMRQLSRPISNFVRKEAKQSEIFRKYICIPPAQCFHWCEVTLKMLLLNLGRPVKVVPLNETMALELGAELLGELIVFAVAAAGLIFETKRQSKKRDFEMKSVNVHSTDLIEATKVLEYRQQRQKMYIQEIAQALAELMFTQTSTEVIYPEPILLEKEKSNAAGRIPHYSPSRCKSNELLYPGDHADDWICDCAPGALYYPDSDSCYPAFRRGPCEAEHMLILARNEVLPQCIKNDCKVDGLVKINNVCYKIGDSAPCPNAQLSYVLGVNTATLMLDCIKLSISVKTRVSLLDDDEPDYDLSKVDLCARGSQRSIEGTCTPSVKTE
ncbi:uncharacterized protein LOC126759300 [Bactrocera neohumeralis]|uniref:uncharacterized protein LOC126759300 n=1 Tax=Bactrocera neohumeralis TaxID=98809 RepID=UPI0021667560|nr:uncharacterized protein LOC126759300 [Bactrocera neohumeralis]